MVDPGFIVEWLDWTVLSGVLDVLVVYYIIYRILLLVRGTRAQPMLLGLFIVILVYIVAHYLHLLTLHWLLGSFLSSIIVVVVVLFQDDLRRALIKVGLSPGFRNDAPLALGSTIDQICRAVSDLSGRRIGALIAITREVGLEEFSERAIKIDGNVSHQLLISIFLPTSPIHDGAVIIDRDRIVCAGAVLPLTFNQVSASLGTRHRAAIGLSEVSDAVVVVVSEETGSISLVREGKISKDLSETSLGNALRRVLVMRYGSEKSGAGRKKSVFGSSHSRSERVGSGEREGGVEDL